MAAFTSTRGETKCGGRSHAVAETLNSGNS